MASSSPSVARGAETEAGTERNRLLLSRYVPDEAEEDDAGAEEGREELLLLLEVVITESGNAAWASISQGAIRKSIHMGVNCCCPANPPPPPAPTPTPTPPPPIIPEEEEEVKEPVENEEDADDVAETGRGGGMAC